MNRKLRDRINLPYVYNTENSQEIAEELLQLQINESGERNVIPLIVHVTYFYYYKKHLTSGTELILIGWKIVLNEEHVQCDHRFASQPLANEPLHSSQLFDTSLQKAFGRQKM